MVSAPHGRVECIRARDHLERCVERPRNLRRHRHPIGGYADDDRILIHEIAHRCSETSPSIAPVREADMALSPLSERVRYELDTVEVRA
jgi:hypothetical protein